MNEKKQHVVIIGAGFAGLWAAKTLAASSVNVTLIDKNNYHTFFPLIYQVGTAEIEPEEIAYPIRTLLRQYPKVSYLREDVKKLDIRKKIIICNNQNIAFDYCIIATGSITNFYNMPGAIFAFPLKTLDEAIILRNHILSCFERAEYCDNEDHKRKLLTFVIIGGGPTGVELAGALAELIHGPLKKDFPRLSLNDVNIILIESAERLLSMMSPSISNYTKDKLNRLNVKIKINTMVKQITHEGVFFADSSFILSETVVWTAGVSGHPLAAQLKLPLSRDNRVKVLKTLQLPESEQVYIVGDLAYFEENGRPLPMIAPVAVQQGKHAANNILKQIKSLMPESFTYKDKGAMVTIGRNSAVAHIAKKDFKGFFAWIIWLVIHILNLIGFRNKIFVLINWAWDYVFFERAVRLILPGCCDDPSSKSCMHRSVPNNLLPKKSVKKRKK